MSSNNKRATNKKGNAITKYLKESSNATTTDQYYKDLLKTTDQNQQSAKESLTAECSAECKEKVSHRAMELMRNQLINNFTIRVFFLSQTKKFEEKYSKLSSKYDQQKHYNGVILKQLAAKDEKINGLEQQILDFQQLSVDDMHEKYKHIFTRAQLSELKRTPYAARNDYTYIKSMVKFMFENGNTDILSSTVKTFDMEMYDIIEEMYESRVKAATSCSFDIASRYNGKKIRKYLSNALVALRQRDGRVLVYEEEE